MLRSFRPLFTTWSLPYWTALVLLIVAGGACTTEAATSKPGARGQRPSGTRPPSALKGTVPRADVGGLISIPGNPLPPVPKESIENAIPIYESLLSAVGTSGDPASRARGIGYLATLYAAVGNYARAEQLFDEALEILTRRSATNLDLGWVHNNRGLARLAQHRYAEAVGSFRSAVDALAPDRSELREPCAIAWQNLASAYHILGDFEEAESAYLEALSILRRLGRGRDQIYQKMSQNLAEVYISIGDAAAARNALESLLAQGEIRDASLRFAVLNNLGEALRHLREFPAAEARLKQALSLTAQGSSNQALALMNLAAVHLDSGDFVNARREGEMALSLIEATDPSGSPRAAAVKASLGTLEFVRGDLAAAETLLAQAKKSLATATEGQQRALAEIDEELALIAQRRGQRDLARDLGRQALDFETKNLDQILAFGSEAQRLAYQSNAFPYDHLANLGEPTLLAEAVLRLKGAVLDSLLRERALARRSTQTADRERLTRISGLKVAVMEAIARGESSGSIRRSDLEQALQREETALAKSLRVALGSTPHADLAGVRGALASDQALVELIRFQLYTSGGKLVPHYGAIVIAAKRQPAWIDLGKADTLEPLIEGLVHQMERGGRGAVSLVATASEEKLAADLRRLYGLLWKPLVSVLPSGTRRILLSPDGALHFVPWAALLDERDELLATNWRIVQINSGRDLLRPTLESANRTLLALADGRGDLPYAQTEVASIKEMAQAGLAGHGPPRQGRF